MEFNFNDVEVSNDYGLIEKGRYNVLISDAKWTENKSGTGEYLKLEFTVVGDKFSGRKIWGIYNLIHTNAVAVNIAKKEVKALLLAVENKNSELSVFTKESIVEKLSGKIVEGQIYIKPGSGEYEDSNAIRNFMPASESPVGDIKDTDVPF